MRHGLDSRGDVRRSSRPSSTPRLSGRTTGPRLRRGGGLRWLPFRGCRKTGSTQKVPLIFSNGSGQRTSTGVAGELLEAKCQAIGKGLLRARMTGARVNDDMSAIGFKIIPRQNDPGSRDPVADTCLVPTSQNATWGQTAPHNCKVRANVRIVRDTTGTFSAGPHTFA